ncbi:AAA family ATPase [Desulfonema magnum]|uniref:AAA ATPase-like domain-containing protein n=1 Tax=Desulfonema magnum TaxID=45655 RepID=A0A975BJH4_9BACT|nr:AAA family ATPase [Desulfonema magnum]QTA86707.1 AAA ATPase-like domain-containing protein [Desulfonema magnum]
MDYFKILNLDKEPFSNSPDPEFFFHSQQHLSCLQKLEISLRLRRGLNVIIGEVGTGKTTLCRQLIRKFANDEDVETHLILDPYFSDSSEFLITVTGMFEKNESEHFNSSLSGDIPDDWHLKEIIKQYLFRKGVDEKKTIIMIIDEGQKLPEFCIEILREFLNYETNEYKLLQIVIFAQKEFREILREKANFADRIDLYHFLGPLNFKDTRQMIQFRVQQSGGAVQLPGLFTYSAFWAIYRATRGYPRKIINLCHRIVLTMIIQNRSVADWPMVCSCVKRGLPDSHRKAGFFKFGFSRVVFCLLFGLIVAAVIETGDWKLKTENSELKTENSELETENSEPEAGNSELETGNWKLETGNSELKTRRPKLENGKLPSEMPLLLGKIIVKKGETLGKLIRMVYSTLIPEYQKAVIRANLHIKNPNRLAIGDVISFPAIPVKIQDSKPELRNSFKGYWVEIAEADNLETAFQLLRAYLSDNRNSRDIPSVRLIPYWHKHNGLKFSLILTEYFSDKISARNRLNRLSVSVFPDGKNVLSFEKETVFFADPFKGFSKK